MKTETPLLDAARQTYGIEARNGAWVELFDLYASSIYKYTLRLCHDSLVADNITGDVFGQLWEQCSQGKGPRTNARSYLYQTAYHLVVDRSRENEHNAPLEVANPWVPGNVQEQVEGKVMLETVLVAMQNELTEDQRHVIILRFLEDFSLKETAEIVGKEVNNIKVIQNRGIAKLRKAMGVDLSGDGGEVSDYNSLPNAGD